MKTIIKDVSILSQNHNKDFIEKGYIVIENQNIIKVGDLKDFTEENFTDESIEIINGKSNYLVVPGFINAHTHIAMTLFRGYADDLPFWTWLTKKIWPQEEKLNGEDAYWGTLLGIIEMIKTGTTTFNDMYMFMDYTAKAVEESGIRGYLSRGLQGTNEISSIGLKENIELFKNWHNKADGRIKVMAGPHAIYTCDPSFWQEVIALVEETGMLIHTHLSESREEVNNSIAQYGKTPVQHLEKLGVFNYPIVAAHGVYLSKEDMDILSKYDISIVHNPVSNLKLGNGFAPISSLLNKGINVALGTDGASSNNNLDLLEEMGYAALIHKGFLEDSTAVSASKTFDMATIYGAKALKWEGIGRIEKGMKADLLMINIDDASFYPRYNLLSNLIYSSNSSRIENVMVNGAWVMKNKELLTIDEEKVFYQVERIKRKFI
ncbi:MAG TPA: amidohydrolase [Eubacteriaceae bacterium]|nr:amidohydrolase [Eubacteriaceae bacterium]